MNEYADLFSKKPESPSPQMHRSQEDTIADYERIAKNRRINNLSLLLYFGLTLLFIGVSIFYRDSLYSDQQLLLDQISVLNEPTFQLSDSEDPNFQHRVAFQTTFRNDSDESLAAFLIEVSFFDDVNNVLMVASWRTEHLGSNQEWVVDESFLIDGTPVRLEINGILTVPNQAGVFLSLLPVMILSILYLFIDWTAFRSTFQRFFQQFGRSFGDILIGIISVYAALLIGNMVLSLLGVKGTSQNEMSIQAMFESNAVIIIMLFFLLCIFTPIVEEVIYRKVLFGYFEPKLGPVVAILLSGSIFGVMHVAGAGDFIQVIPYLLMGFAFGYVYYRSEKNIWVPIIVHFLNNFIVFLIYAPSLAELI